MERGLFVPGWGAPARLYRRGVPPAWTVLELPPFRQTSGTLDRYRAEVGAALADAGTPVALAGHSMGAALAALAVLERPAAVRRLVLLAPAGLPLAKPLRSSALAFAAQVARGCYSPRALAEMAANAAAAPAAAWALARAVHDLDLTPELGRLRDAGVSCTVVGCTTDALTTCAHCRRLAALAGAEYRELAATGGHIWPVTHPDLLRRELAPFAG